MYGILSYIQYVEDKSLFPMPVSIAIFYKLLYNYGKIYGFCWHYLVTLKSMIFFRGGVIILYKIILVDDEIATRKGLISGIKWESLGLKFCGEAKDGIEGLELARRVQPHVILTDVRMPL